jgi:hypothetical protein
VFPYHSSQRDHCFLHGCPSFALPLNPSLKCIYTAPFHKRIRNEKIACTKTQEREKRKRVLKVKD